MKSLVLFLSIALGFSVFADPMQSTEPVPTDLAACQGSYLVTTDGTYGVSFENVLEASARAQVTGFNVINTDPQNTVYEIWADTVEQIPSALALMQVIGGLDGVIVECNSASDRPLPQN